jgi:hypothetical protein
MSYFYDIQPGNKISAEMAGEIDKWLIEMVGEHRVNAGLIRNTVTNSIIQRIAFTNEDDRNLFALYISGLDLAKK